MDLLTSAMRLWHAKVSKSMLITSLKQCSPSPLGIFPSQVLYTVLWMLIKTISTQGLLENRHKIGKGTCTKVAHT